MHPNALHRKNAVLTAVYTKMLGPKKDMAKYIYEFARHTLRDGGKVREEASKAS